MMVEEPPLGESAPPPSSAVVAGDSLADPTPAALYARWFYPGDAIPAQIGRQSGRKRCWRQSGLGSRGTEGKG